MIITMRKLLLTLIVLSSLGLAGKAGAEIQRNENQYVSREYKETNQEYLGLYLFSGLAVAATGFYLLSDIIQTRKNKKPKAF